MIQISLCDEVSIGQFGKMNLMGLNPGDVLTVPHLSYKLFSTLVIQAIFDPGDPTVDVSFIVQEKDLNGIVFPEERFPIANLNRANPGQGLSLFFVQPLTWNITNYGTVRFAVVAGDIELGYKAFKIVQGYGPTSLLTAPITSSSVITESKGFILETILMSANKTLILIDQFLKLDDLVDLMDSVPSESTVKVLTQPDWRKNYLQSRSTIDGLPQRIEVKFSERFHDRYVIANDTEYFHFGYSLKDLWKRRVSRYAKLYRKDEIEDLKDLYETEWKVAQTL